MIKPQKVHCPDHPFANGKGYVYRSRLVMEFYLGRYLDSFELVHHIDEIKNHDIIENLELCCKSSHISYHHKGKVVSEESKRKNSLAHRCENLSNETRAKMSFSSMKANLSEETLRKMSLGRRGKIVSEETRRKLSLAGMGKEGTYGFKGKLHSHETRMELSEIAKIREANKRKLRGKKEFDK